MLINTFIINKIAGYTLAIEEQWTEQCEGKVICKPQTSNHGAEKGGGAQHQGSSQVRE